MLFALFMGSWSDQHGRKVPLLLPMAGTVVTCVVYVVFSAVTTMPAQFLLMASVPIGERPRSRDGAAPVGSWGLGGRSLSQAGTVLRGKMSA